MHPLVTTELARLRAEDLHREAGAARLVRATASSWDHKWRRGLGAQLERWGERLQGGARSQSTPHLGRD